MIKMTIYSPNIKPGTYFKNPNEKLRYEVIEIIFGQVEEKLKCYFDILDHIPQEISTLKNKKFWFFKEVRNKKRINKIEELRKDFSNIKFSIEINNIIYEFLAKVLDDPDSYSLVKVVSFCYQEKLI